MLQGKSYRIVLILLGLPLLFGFALYNGVKSAGTLDRPLQTPDTTPEIFSGQLLETTIPAPVTVTPTATVTQTPAVTAAQIIAEVDTPTPQTAELDGLPSPSPTPTTAATAAHLLAEEWKEWPVIPTVSDEMREVYHQGMAQGNNPHAFSILGDCQSLPEVFLGLFDEDPSLVAQLPGPWQETVGQFQGSFNRYSPTVKDGTTEGALLWGLWNDNEEGKCRPGESPLDCELRVHRPSIVLIHVGTHWEARNRHYLTIILDKVLEHGAVPVLVTKADNRELDERVNQNYAELAVEYGVPLWNFWFSVQNLPEHGMEPDSDMYLSPAGLEIHRVGALQVLDAVWRAVR